MRLPGGRRVRANGAKKATTCYVCAPHDCLQSGSRRMKRILLLVILVTVAVGGGRALYHALASDRRRIDWLLREEVDAFDAANVLNLMPHFATDYRDDTAGIDAQMLRGGVVWAWQNERDASGGFAWHLELPEGAGEVTLDGDAATAVFPLQLWRRSADTAQLVWGLRVHAQLQRRDGAWWLVRSTHETIEGKAPRTR